MDTQESNRNRAAALKRTALAGACLTYPLFAGIAFASHPNLLSLQINQPVQDKILEFHGNRMMHFGHFLMFLGVFSLIIIALHLMNLLSEKRPLTSLIGGAAAVAGAVILAVDKGTLCFVPSAFDSVGPELYDGLLPGIKAMFDLRGYLWILKLLPLLPAGFIILSAALLGSKTMEKRFSLPILAGSILMMNPDIDIIGLTATLVMAAGFIPYGLAVLRNPERSRQNLLNPV